MLFLCMGFTLPSGFAQRLGFVTSTPRIDSFPKVRLKMTATYNGKLPQPGILPSNLNVVEDTYPVSNLSLEGCDESGQAAVVFCVDASTSVVYSAGDTWNIYKGYFNSFSKFISIIPSASKYALVCFTDSVDYFPGPSKLGGFYTGQTPNDSADFQYNLRNRPFKGFTDVDHAVNFSVNLLRLQPFAHKAIVMVTDDAIENTPYFDSLLDVLGITLYVMEIGADGAPINRLVTHETGGLYMEAKDSSQWVPTMQQLAELVFGEHCLLTYTSANPCPWVKLHDISLTLNYKGLSKNLIEQYSLGHNIFDKDPPAFTVTSPAYTSRLITAAENFPCTRGMKSFGDSVLFNFKKLTQYRNYPNLATDSIAVTDSLQPARCVFVATDSANNKGRTEVLYTPKPDTLSPEILYQKLTGPNYRMLVTEVRSWDRGLQSMLLLPGAINIVLDSMVILNRRVGQAWLHKPDPNAEAIACFQAIDSSGNVGMYCIRSDSVAGDTLPPIIVQDPIVSPRLAITGIVTEERKKDIGIKNITVFPAPNAGTSSPTYFSQRRAVFSVPIIDSLQPIRALISASDTLGNTGSDTLRYDPLPDNTAPVCAVESPNLVSRIFHATEFAPWDRGIASVALIGSASNLTVGPVIYKNVYEADQTFTVIDPYSAADAIVQTFDSSGHECETTISISPQPRPLVLFSTTPIDFGTVYAPTSVKLPVEITNQNEAPVVITKFRQTGDLPIFSSDLATPISFLPFEKKIFTITFSPSLLGSWKSEWTISNDTMMLGSFTAIGTSIGKISVVIDTISVPKTQLQSRFRVSISATPAPINLDTIAFTLNYDADFADLLITSPMQPDCSSGNPLCNYTIISSALSYGKQRFLLTRNDPNVENILSFTTSSFEIPFNCFVAKKDTTVLSIEDLFVSQHSTIEAADGMITVGNECGDKGLRSFLNGKFPVLFESVTPNPASRTINIIIAAAQPGDAQLSLVNNLGEVKIQKNISLTTGKNSCSLDLSAYSSGYYQVILSSSGEYISSQIIDLIH